MRHFLDEEVSFKGIPTVDEEWSEHQWFIENFVNFAGFERSVILKILKGYEKDSVSKKVSLISDYCKKEAEKKEKEEKKMKSAPTEESKGLEKMDSHISEGSLVKDLSISAPAEIK